MTKGQSMTMTPEQATWFSDIFGRLVANVDQVLLGKTFVIRLGFTALLSEGHLLLEDYPGTGKTSFLNRFRTTSFSALLASSLHFKFRAAIHSCNSVFRKPNSGLTTSISRPPIVIVLETCIPRQPCDPRIRFHKTVSA